MHLISVNAAKAITLTMGGKPVSTGIAKKALTGPVSIGEHGVDGDTIVDTTFHGGLDQAVYLYSNEDYKWWSKTLDRELTPGIFGENLTLSEFPERTLKVGDRLRIGKTLYLELTAPRIPCAKFAARMGGDPTFLKQFISAVRPGSYARVLSPGSVEAGDSVSWEPVDAQLAAAYAGINELFIAWHKQQGAEDIFKRALASPISSIARNIIEQRYLKD